MSEKSHRLPSVLAQLRHLFQQMIDGQVVDTAAAARGLLGPAIVELELELTERPVVSGIPGMRVRLTPRELEVAQCVVKGLTNKETAKQLGVSDDVVKFHVSNLRGKLCASSRAELGAILVRERLVE